MAPTKCFGCNSYINKKSTAKIAGNRVFRQFLEHVREQRGVGWIEPAPNSKMCIDCYRTFRRQPLRMQPNENEMIIELDNNENNNVDNNNDHMPFLKLITTERFCCVCGLPNRHRFPAKAVLELWMRHKIFCHPNNRSCPEHLQNGHFSQEAVASIQLRAARRPFTARDHEILIDLLTNRVILLEEKCKIFDFDSDKLDDDDCLALTGLNKADFNTLVEYCDNLTPRYKVSKKNCVAIFLIKLRVDPTQKILGMMFGMKPKQQARVSEIFNDVLSSLITNFVPHYLGYNHLTREDYGRFHSTTTSNRLCRNNPDSIVVLVDATYLFHQKPFDHLSQRKTYSVPKHHNLVKFSVTAAPDGYIMDVTGPHPTDGRNNDSSIFNAMALNDDGFLTFFREDDNIIYDRGYRDSIQFCQNFGLNVLIPHSVLPGQRQLTTQQANESRIVTMMRWVIEAVFGRVQNKFRFLRNIVPNRYGCETLGNIFKVSCAISNAFFPPINESAPDDNVFCDRVLEQLNRPNLLLNRLRQENLIRARIHWPLVDGFLDLEDFPILSENEIQDLTHGTYQIRLAYAYTSSHLNNGQYLVRLHRQPNVENHVQLIRASIPSRYQAAHERKCFIEYNTLLNGIEAITGWACLCKSGARVLGMCGHVCSVIWFLSYARHHPELRYPSRDMADNLLDVVRLNLE